MGDLLKGCGPGFGDMHTRDRDSHPASALLSPYRVDQRFVSYNMGWRRQSPATAGRPCASQRRHSVPHLSRQGHFSGPHWSGAHPEPVSGPSLRREEKAALENTVALQIGAWEW